MSVPHVSSGQVIELNDRLNAIENQHSQALVKTSDFETILMQLRQGHSIPDHSVTGPVTVQCLRGNVCFRVDDTEQDLAPGSWMYLEPNTVHALTARTDCSLLVTVVFSEGTHA